MLSFEACKAPWQMADLPKETPVLLAFSGGADSAALLQLLAEQARRDGFSLTAAHFHHGIRGEEADRDAAFCQERAAQLQIPFVQGRADVPAHAKETGESLETAARSLRYAFLERVMEERQIPILVTAHHADDNLETLLFRMSRGTGLSGLCGIPPVRAFGTGVVVRPLLPFSRREILEYCVRARVDYVTDSTNLEPDCSRNRIRLEAVPALERSAGDPQRSAWRMTESLRQDRDCLDEMAMEVFRANRTPHGIRLQALREAHPAIRRRVMILLLPGTPEAVHLEALERLVTEGQTGASVALAGGYAAVLSQKELTVLPDRRELPGELPLPFEEGAVALCDGSMTLSVKKIEKSHEGKKVHNLSTDHCIILCGVSDIMIKQMRWRTRREGDRILVGGKHRQVRRLCIPKGIGGSNPLLSAN